jgi:hypothetical protein
MGKRISVLFLLSLLTLFVLVSAALGAVDAKQGKRPIAVNRVDGAQDPSPYAARSPVMYEGAKVSDCEAINPEVPVSIVASTGMTYYDYQKNGSMGRMIAVGPGGHRHFVFHETRGDYADYPRYVTYNCTDGAGFWVGPTWVDGGEDNNSGYANILTMHDGREVILYHSTLEEPEAHTKLAVGDKGYVCSGYFTNWYDLPDYHDSAASSTPNGYWPKGCIMYDADTDTDYIHIITTENTTGVGQSAGYLRCVFQGDNLKCRSPGWGPYTRIPNTIFPSPMDKIDVWEHLGTINAVMASSPVSKRVAIVYLKNRDDYSTQQNNDVAYIESMNNGDDWFATGFTAPVNVTNYPSAGTERAYTDVSACYDYNDSLHIVWNACWYDSAASQESNDANLKHWSKATGISTIAPGYWEGTSPGNWNRNVSKMNVSAKDPIYHPGGDPDSVYLFASWTQFNPGDNSAADNTNGDIYAAVSNDAGFSWAPGRNLTNTQTPDCAAGECLSEHWSSMALNMYGGDLHIQYVCDRDAGGVVQDEGGWTDNDMIYLHVPQLTLETACGITYTYGDPPSLTVPPIKVSPDKGSRVVTFDIQGLYNLGGNFEVTSDHGSVSITGNASGYLGPGQIKTVEATITCSAQGFIAARISVRGCIGTDDENTLVLRLYAVCSHDYYECARAANTTIEKDNGKLKLWVCANSAQQVWHKWIQPEDNQQVIFYGGTFVATIATDDPTDTAIGRQDYREVYTGARDTINRYCGEWNRYEPECLVQKIHVENTYVWKVRAQTWPPQIRWYWIDVYKQIFMFHDHPTAGSCPDWKKDVIIKYIWIKFSRPPLWWPEPGAYPGHGDIYLGYFADVDAPFDEGCNGCNTAGYDDPREMIWLHGYYSDTVEDPHPEYEDFYVGLTFTDPTGAVVEPLGMQCVRNDSFVYPNDGWGLRTDQFYELITASGENIHDPDSVVDRTVVLTSGMIPAGGSDDTTFQAEYILIEAAVQGEAGLGLQELQAEMDLARGTMVPELNGYGLFDKNWKRPICGDVYPNGEINSGDIIRLVGYVFLGESDPPWPMECRADVTGNGVIDSGDIVRLIGYVFLGESAPPCPAHCGCPEG